MTLNERRLRTRDASPAQVPRTLRFQIERPHLINRIASLDGPLVVLLAPTGYGKTTLLSEYWRSGLRHMLWLSLSTELCAVSDMYRSLTAQLRDLDIGLDFQQHPPQNDADTAMTLARSLDQAEENLMLVFDGFDVLEAEAVRWVQRLALALADGHRVCILGHETNGLPLARLVSEGSAAVIGPNELAFSPGEVSEYARLRQVDDQILPASLEGWPVAIALAASQQASALEPANLLEEAISRLPDDVRDALHEAAVLCLWNEERLRQNGVRLPSGWLRMVLRSGLPLRLVGSGSFRPHPILLEQLNLQLKARPDRYVELHQRAAALAEEHNEPVEALHHHLQAGREGAALTLAEQSMFELEMRREHKTIRAALERFTPDRLPSELRATLGHALIETGETPRGESILRELRTKGEANMRVLYALAELAQFRQQKVLATQLMAEGINTASDPVWRSRFERLQLRTLIEERNDAEVARRSLVMLEVAEREHDKHAIRGNLLTAQIGLMGVRRWQEAEQVGFRGLRICEADQLWPQATMFMNNLGEQYRRQDRLDDAVAILDRATLLAESIEAVPLAFLCETLAELHFRQVDFERAIQNLQKALRHCGGRSFDGLAQNVRLKLVYAALRVGNQALAKHALNRVREHPPEAGTRLHDSHQFGEAVAAFFSGDFELADGFFAKVNQETADEDDFQRSLIFRAELARRRGTLVQAQISALIAALDGQGNDGVLRIDQQVVGALYSECLLRNWWPDRFRPYAAGFQRFEPIPEQSKDAKLELRLQSLGAVQASIAGVRAHIPLVKAGELLVWLALQGPSSRERILEALWDGSNDQRHIEYLKVILRRLRASFGEHPMVDFNPLLFEHGVYQINPQLSVRLDATAITEALRAKDVRLLERAVMAYKGQFLPACQSEWACTERQRLHDEALATAMGLAAQLEPEDPKRAGELYRAAVRIDPFHDQAHRGLIQNLLTLGDQVAARVAFTAYSHMLETEFSAQPDQTMRLQFQD
jgi:LuxR family transcriptional regulator, maltose regulon positive regulatory protein